jgi:hypothetical protein
VELPLRTHPYNCSSDYTVLLHYTAPDRHGRLCNVEGRPNLCQSHNFATYARHFDLPSSKAMSTHTRAHKFNLSVLHGTYIACTQALCELWYVLPPIVTTGFITNNFVAIAHVRENTIFFGIWLGIFLFYATVVYLNTSTNKNHRITSNVNNAWYDMVSSSTCLISIEPPTWSPSVHRCGAKCKVPPWSLWQYHTTYRSTISHHRPRCKTKLDASTLCLQVLRGF